MTDQEIQSAIVNGITAGLKPFEAKINALEAAQAKGASTAAATADETALTKALAKAMEPITQKLTAIETDALAGRKAQAKAAVKFHVDRGAIAPEEKLPSGKLLADYYEEAYLANAADAEAALKKLPGRNLGRVIHGAGNGGTATAGAAEFSPEENQILAGAKKLRETNKAIASDAQAIEMYLRTQEGNALYQELHEQRVQQAKAKGRA